ncbi:Nucleoside-diphosphate-sugar epimerase [Shimia marina]|uniref:UDP-glucose 4-epimerase n=2 Tax=Shimia marina TaxID=321267 RepID=A0A0N7LRQ6_9RHOB|nr:UDP-glucose 4-epimerase [Shimia marina]SFD47936.1 Nucleoside-diphosphate-sugar epimerase [Shimia marina]
MRGLTAKNRLGFMTLTSETCTEPANDERARTLLILGANGKLGRLMRAACARIPELQAGWRIIWAARREGAGIDLVVPNGVLPTGFPQADAVLALWGVVPGQGNLEDNTLLAQRALEVARASGAQRVLHCSSSAVYGPGRDCDEQAALTPVNAYGLAKIAMEEHILAQKQADAEWPESCLLRIANVVGADSLFAAMTRGGPVTLDAFEVGQSPVRSYATPEILWQAVCAALSAERLPEVLNVAAANPVAMHQLLEAAQHRFVWQPAPFTAVAEVSMNVTRLQRLTGRRLTVPPEEMIRQWQMLCEEEV